MQTLPHHRRGVETEAQHRGCGIQMQCMWDRIHLKDVRTGGEGEAMKYVLYTLSIVSFIYGAAIFATSVGDRTVFLELATYVWVLISAVYGCSGAIVGAIHQLSDTQTRRQSNSSI